MGNVVVQAAGLFALVAAVVVGYWLWVRPHRVGRDARSLLLLVVLTCLGGIIGSTGWWIDDPSAFSWDLPPLASRMLGAAAVAFGAATLIVLRRPTTTRLRLVLLMLVVYLAPLTVAILVFHLDRFDFGAPITYAFFILVAGIVLPALWFLARQPVVIPDTASDLAAPPLSVRRWLLLAGIATAVWGAALFVTESGPVAPVWVWPGDLLTSRLIAVMLLTVAAASFYGMRHHGPARMTLVTIGVYGAGAVVAGMLNASAGRPIPVLYVAALGAMALVSAALFVRDNK